jgi:hypothetical protein
MGEGRRLTHDQYKLDCTPGQCYVLWMMLRKGIEDLAIVHDTA